MSSKTNVRYIFCDKQFKSQQTVKNIALLLHTTQILYFLTVSFTPPPLLFLCRNIFISNPFTKNAIVSSYCVLSVTSIVILCNIAFVSLNSGNDPTAAFAALEVVNIDDAADAVVIVAASNDC